jgi:L-rhamnono-1,4-lactonase
MKLSGAFSEFGTITPLPVVAITARLSWWVRHVFGVFGPERIMFGSDWPVCNVNGPKGGQSWGVWREVVEALMQELRIDEAGQGRVWWGTGCEVYGVDIS